MDDASPDEAPPQRAATVPDAGVHLRAQLYGDQLMSRSQKNDPQWRATVGTLQSLDRVHKLGETRRRLENLMFALALVAICCAMIESELLWSQVQNSGELLIIGNRDASDGSAIKFSVGFVVLKCVLSTATLGLVGALVLRYRVVCQILVETKQVGARAKFFHSSSGLLAPFLAELVVCAFHIPPFASSALSLEWQRQTNFYLDQLDVLVLLRVYLLGRFLRNWLGFNASAYYVHLIGAFHHVDVMSIWFTTKYTFQRFPFQSTMAALFIDWVLTSAALNFLERDLAHDRDNDERRVRRDRAADARREAHDRVRRDRRRHRHHVPAARDAHRRAARDAAGENRARRRRLPPVCAQTERRRGIPHPADLEVAQRPEERKQQVQAPRVRGSGRVSIVAVYPAEHAG